MIRKLMQEAYSLQYELNATKKKIEAEQVACGKRGHNWADPIYYPEVIQGYTLPAYHQGVHHYDEERVPDQIKPRWERTCKNCYLHEMTSEVTEQTTKTPKFKGD